MHLSFVGSTFVKIIVISCTSTITEVFLVSAAAGVADERRLLEDMQRELDNMRNECNSSQERIVQLGCENFELEKELKETKEKLKNLEIEYRELDEAHRACSSEQERRDNIETDYAAKVNSISQLVRLSGIFRYTYDVKADFFFFLHFLSMASAFCSISYARVISNTKPTCCMS